MENRTTFQRSLFFLCLWLAIVLIPTLSWADPVALYVSPNGDDNNDGSMYYPFLTIAAAQTRTRQLRSGGQTGPVTIYLRAGRYFQSIPLTFNAQDSGLASSSTTYRNYPGEEAIITGSKVLTGFASVTDSAVLSRLNQNAQAQVQFVNLPSQGITDYGTLRRRGGFLPVQLSALELFFNGERMHLARYPNTGWDRVAGLTQYGFIYTDPRPVSWSSFEDIWVHGYFSNTWADSRLKVSTIDTNSRAITVEGGFDSYGVRTGYWFSYENVLEELDSAGEYYLDRVNGNLYFWLPFAPESRVTVSLTSKLLVGNSFRYVIFEGLTFEGARSHLVDITNSDQIKFYNVTFLDAGNDALRLTNVTNTIVTNSNFNQIGERAIYIKGGDRTSLTSSNNVIINNVIHDTSQLVRTNRAAIEPNGVGTKVAHNEFYNIPQISVRFFGNDHSIYKNSFHNVVTEVAPDNQTTDTGVVYHGRDYTARGNVINNNFFKDIGNNKLISGAVYLDDGSSGQTVKGNFFDNVGRALMVGGGRDNTIDNNVIVNTAKPMAFDSRGYQSLARSEWMANRFYLQITDASNTSPIIITLANRHGINQASTSAPRTMDVSGVQGNTAANGTWSYEVVSPNQLRLLNSVGNGAYTGGGDVIATVSLFYSQLDAVHYGASPYKKYAGIFNYTKYTLGEPVRNIFTHNIIAMGNKPPGPWIAMYPTTPPFLNFTNGVIHGADNSVAVPNGNSTADPQFVNPGAGDYRVRSSSPALPLGFQELPYETMGRLSNDQLLIRPQDQTVAAQATLDLQIIAPYFTEEATNPTYTFDFLPSGASFNQQTRTLTWTPQASQIGTYDFFLTVSDNYLTAETSFLVTVVGNNQFPPDAYDQSVATDEDTSKDITLTASGTNPGSVLTYEIRELPAHGSLTGQPPNVNYLPELNYNGEDAFKFRATDQGGLFDEAEVSITIISVNDPPTADGQAVVTNEDTPKAITLTASDVENDQLTYTIVTPPAHGSLTGQDNGLAYIPESNYNGLDKFTFKANDGNLDSNIATVKITVNPINDTPVLNPIGNKVVYEGRLLEFTVTATDADNDSLSYSFSGLPGATFSGLSQGATFFGQRFSWKPNYTQAGNYNVTFSVKDGNGGRDSETITISVTNVNRAPVLNPISDRQVNNGKKLTVYVMATDLDLPDDVLSYSLVGPSGATIEKIDNNHAIIRWVARRNNSIPISNTQINIFRVSVKDRYGFSNTKEFKVMVRF